MRSRAAVAKNSNRKDRKGKDRKGEAATETSELGTTKSPDLLRASAKSWYVGVYVNIWRSHPAGELHVVERSQQRTGFPLACSSHRFRKTTIMIWRQRRGPPAMCGIDLPSVRSTIFLLGIAPAWCVLSAKTGICPPSTRCRPVFLLRFQCSAILRLPGLSSERIPFAPMCGASTVSLGNSHLRKLVQYSGICRAPAYTFGDAGRNSIYRPGTQTLDLALVRDFSLTERARFQFRGNSSTL